MGSLIDVTQKQILRGYALKISDMAEPLGASIEVIRGTLKKEGFGEYSKNDILEAGEYLQKKGLIEIKRIKNEVLKIERYIFKVTAKGTDLLEGTIIEDGIELV